MKRTLLLASTCALALQAVSAIAQDMPLAADSAADAEEIVVTAQGRANSLMDVPLAISAISADQLAATGAADLRGMMQLAPSLTISGGTSESRYNARIRGVGTTGDNFGLEASVALFIDGVYRTRTGVGMNELGELERVEVLRGPQGTLAGRNSTAGAIYIVTKKPEFDLGGYGAVSYGNYDYTRLEAGVTGPVVAGNIAARLDASWTKRDGFIENVTANAPDYNDRDRWLVRGQMLLEPTEDVSVRLIGDYSKRNEFCCGAVYLNPIQNVSRNAQGEVVTSPNTVLPGLQALGANIQVPPPGEPFVFRTATTAGVPPVSDSKDWGVSGEVNWNLGETSLTSITSYRDHKTHQGADADFTALDLLDFFSRDPHYETFTQEARLQGSLFDNRLDWLVGGYYANETVSTFDNALYGADIEKLIPASVTIATALGARRLPGTGAIANTFKQDSENYAAFTHNIIQIVPDRLSLTLGLRYTHETKQIESSVNSTNNLCDRTVNSPFQPAAAAFCLLGNTQAPSLTGSEQGTKISDGEWTGTAVLSFRPIGSVMTYASYSRGYKAGGFNLDAAGFDRVCSTTAGTPAQNAACVALRAKPAFTQNNGRAEATDLQFAPEKVTSYEIGAKWDGPGIDASLALYYASFRNFQLNNFNGIFFEVLSLSGCKDSLQGGDIDADANTGACAPDRLGPGVKSKGAEFDVQVRPVDDVQFGIAFNYNDAKYERDLTGTRGAPLQPSLFQLPGGRTYGPEYGVTGSAAWTPELGGDLSALIYLDFRYGSDNEAITNSRDIEKEQDGFGLINGRLGLYGEDKLWGVELWGQNLLNTKYIQQGASAPLQGSGTFRGVAAGLIPTATALSVGFPGEPRTYGVTVKKRF